MKSSAIWDTAPDCEIVTTRVVEAPQKLVYKAWTDPNYLKTWWGPKGFTNTFQVFDFQVGGKWSFVMHGPDKGNYQNECTFVLIEEPRLLVWDRQSQPIFQVEASFDEISPTETKITFKQKFRSVQECDKLRKFVPEKKEENMDRLEHVLATMK